MNPGNERAIVKIGGVPTDLNAGVTDAVTNPPPGFVSRHTFSKTDIATRVEGITWFVRCGQVPALDLTMPLHTLNSWREALVACRDPSWETAQLEAQNQLSLWLHNHARDEYQSWNERVGAHKTAVIAPLTKTILGLQREISFEGALVASVQWDILGALMENDYLSTGHSAFFFLELLWVYEAGHFPCGWQGAWPEGCLILY